MLQPSSVKQTYRYLDDEDQKRFYNLSTDVKQEIFKDSSLALSEKATFSKDTEQGILQMLEDVRPLHLGSNATLGDPWENIVKNYSGSKTGSALYSHVRSPGYTNELNKLDVDWKSFAKPPELHHLIYKKEEPKSAVQIWNLMLATRGSSKNKSVGQHEGMLHQVSSPQGRPNISQSVYLNEVPAVKGLIRQWALNGAKPKTKEVPNIFYNSIFDDFSWMNNPTGPSSFFLEEPQFNDTFNLPTLDWLEKDNARNLSTYYGDLLSGWDAGEHDHYGSVGFDTLQDNSDFGSFDWFNSGYNSSYGFGNNSNYVGYQNNNYSNSFVNYDYGYGNNNSNSNYGFNSNFYSNQDNYQSIDENDIEMSDIHFDTNQFFNEDYFNE